MLETLAQFDLSLFLFLNITVSNPVTDFLMPVITNDWLLRILYAVAMAAILWKGNKNLRLAIIGSALVLLATDQISSAFLKPLFARPRPCHAGILEHINLLVRCGGGMSMPSSHAANAFGQAIFFGFLYKNVRIHLFLFASTVAISRVFVGVHYPADVLVGSFLGAIIGLTVAFLFSKQSYARKNDVVTS